MRHILVSLLVLIFSSFPVVAQELTEDQILKAIENGRQSDPEDIGLILRSSAFDPNDLLGSFIASQLGGETKDGWDKFAIAVYTPETWIGMAAAQANAHFETFTVDDVTEDMLQPVLRVFIKPNNRTNAVIRDTKKNRVVNPVFSAPCADYIYFGREIGNNCVELHFPLDQVRYIQSMGNDEFYITIEIVGRSRYDHSELSTMTRDFKVKRKHLNDLAM